MSGTFQGRLAYASIKYTAGVPAILSQSGDFLVAVTDGGVGDFTLTFNEQIDPSEACISLACRGASGAAYVASWTDTTLRILVTDLAGVAADVDCDIIIAVKPAN